MNRLQQSRRQQIGYSYNPQVNNNVAKQTYRRDTYAVLEKQFDQNSYSSTSHDMAGEGVMDLARGLYNKGKAAASYLYGQKDLIKKGAEMAADAYGSELGTSIKNLLPSSDENARPSFAGERHAILQLPNGKYGTANWMGPGTQVIKRLKRGDPARTQSDKVAMRHDIDYTLAAGMKDKEAQHKAVREADQRMVASLNRIAQNKGDAQKNIFQGRRLIQGKMAAEDVGLLSKDKFAGDLKPISDQDTVLLMSKQAGLSQEGYGMLPGEALKMKLIKNMRRKKGKGLGLSGGGLGLPGKGLGLSGGGLGLSGGYKSMSKSYGTSKGYPMKGGFFFLAPLIALAAEAISGITVASVGSAVATGAASAAAGAVTKKIIGSKKMKGKGVKEIAQKVAGAVAGTIKKNKQKIITIAESTGVLPKDLPKKVLEHAQKALDIINEVSGKTGPSKTSVLKVVDTLIPHIKEVFHKKMENKMKGSGVSLPGSGMMIGAGHGFNKQVLNVVSQML
jgi:hypothetical protein